MAEKRRTDARGPVLCEYFVTCQRTADGTVTHELAGAVPICARCARLVRVTPRPWAEP